MRDVPEELAARIENGAATLCQAWIVTRADGTRIGATDHDRDLTVGGVICLAGAGWTAGAVETAEGLTAGEAAVSGALNAGGVEEADIVAGLWDGAEVEHWRVDWERPDLKVRMGRGRLSRIRREGEGFTTEIEGPLAALERVVGRAFARTCDAVLGDGRCNAFIDGRTCDKRFETCVSVFDNAVNFRGFPDIPGDDFLTAYPATGGRHDGRSRR